MIRVIKSLIRSCAAIGLAVSITMPSAGLAFADPSVDASTVPVPPPVDSVVIVDDSGSLPEPGYIPPAVEVVPPVLPPVVQPPVPVEQVPPPVVVPPSPVDVPPVVEPAPEVVQQPISTPAVEEVVVPVTEPDRSATTTEVRQDPVVVAPPVPEIVHEQQSDTAGPVSLPEPTKPSVAVVESSVQSPQITEHTQVAETPKNTVESTVAPTDVSSQESEEVTEQPSSDTSSEVVVPPVPATDIPIPDADEVPTVVEDSAVVQERPVFKAREVREVEDEPTEVAPEVQAKLDKGEIEEGEMFDPRDLPEDWDKRSRGDRDHNDNDEDDEDHQVPPRPLDPDRDYDKVEHYWRDHDDKDRDHDNEDRDHHDRGNHDNDHDDEDDEGDDDNEDRDHHDRDWDDVDVRKGPNGRPMVVNNTVNIVNMYFQNFVTNEVRVMPVYPYSAAYIGGNLCGGAGASFGWSANVALGAFGFGARFSAGGMFSVGGAGCGYIPPPVLAQPLYFTAAGYGQWSTPYYSQPSGCGCVYAGGAYMYGQYQNQPVYMPGYPQPQIRPVFIVDGWKGDYVFERQLTGGLPQFLTGEDPKQDVVTAAAPGPLQQDYVLWVLGLVVVGAAAVGAIYNRDWILRHLGIR